MRTSLEQQVAYTVLLGDDEVPLNQYLGRHLQLDYQGVINCIACERKTGKM